MTPNTPMTELPVELEPCPFCGGEAEYQTDTEEPGFAEEWIGCLKCGATTAVEIWNRRASQSLRAPAGEVIEALQLARDAIGTLPPFALGGVSYDDPQTGEYAGQYPVRDELLATIDAALASPPSEGVKVKPLEWVKSLPTVQHAFTGFGTFYGVEPAGGGWVLTKHEGSSKTKSFWNDEASAKGAAFDHFSAAILSALEPTP